jgi:hypothetical protein
MPKKSGEICPKAALVNSTIAKAAWLIFFFTQSE